MAVLCTRLISRGLQDTWTVATPIIALSSPGAAIVTVSGNGFKAAADYTCEFSTDTTASPIVGTQSLKVVGARGTAVTSKRITCASPHWPSVEKPTKLKVYWGSCAGAGGVATGCATIDRVGDYEQPFKFEASTTYLEPPTFFAGHVADATLEIWGGGFDPDRPTAYLAQFGEPAGNHVNVSDATVTGATITIKIPRWGYAPNGNTGLTLYDGARVIPFVGGGAVQFVFNSSWTDS
ncbi:hypothetical protein T484DRAFT_1768209, partial [Baffinella frigidus]